MRKIKTLAILVPMLAAALVWSQNAWGQNNVQTFGAKGNGSTDDTQAIQAAIDATPMGGELYLPPACYRVTQTLSVTKPIRIYGAGKGSMVCVDPSSIADVFLVQPTVDGNSITFENMSIIPISGAPGRYGIHLNGSTSIIGNLRIRNVTVNQLGSAAIYGEGSGLAQGTPVAATIQESTLFGGIVLTTAGDTVRILDNFIAGRGSVEVTFQPGAGGFVFERNNVQSQGGLRIAGNAVAPKILSNEIETPAAFNGQALIDIEGTPASSVQSAVVQNNSIQVVNGTSPGLRLNFANRTTVENNFFYRVNAGTDLLKTANATNTWSLNNSWSH